MSNFPMNVFSIFSDQEDNKVDLVKVERQSDYENPIFPPEIRSHGPGQSDSTNMISNSNYCGCCERENKGFYYLDKSADRDDIIFICYSCGSLMTNSQENLDYYNKLMEILGVVKENELNKSIAFENHFQNNYKTPKIKKAVKKFMFYNGRWV